MGHAHTLDNWDDIRIFLAVARHGGLTNAAQILRVNHTTVARRLSGLEASLRTRLVVRTPAGVTLTPEGEELMRFAERMEAESIAAEQNLQSSEGRISGKVRLATREAFGPWVVCPKIGLLLDRHPDLSLELVPEARTFNLLKHDVDLSVTVKYPSQDRLITQKLTDYRVGLYASPLYLEREGPVISLDDLRDRQVIWYVEEMIDVDQQRYLSSVVSTSRSAFRATNIIAQYAAAIAGFGIAILPVYQAGQDAALVRILAGEVEETLSYWLSIHPDSQNLPNVRAVMNFLTEIVRERREQF